MKKYISTVMMIAIIAVSIPMFASSATAQQERYEGNRTNYGQRNNRTTTYKKPSLYRRHRNLFNIAMGTGAGAIIGALIGGKRGAGIGAIAALAVDETSLAQKKVSFPEVHRIIQARCVNCHAQYPSNTAFASPPAGMIMEDPAQIAQLAPRILERVWVNKTMPLGNQTKMTEEEREKVAASIVQGAEITVAPRFEGEHDPAMVDKAKVFYAERCVTCHGKEGHGDGPAAIGMLPRPTNLTDRLRHAQVSDDELRKVILGGGFVATRDSDGRRGILTLYAPGSEPDQAIYDLLSKLPRDHVSELFATGRWQDRAYDVAEEFNGGTLADFAIDPVDQAAIRKLVGEVAQAVHVLAEAGLRHRDLRPSVIFMRSRDPLDLVIGGFGSARRSEFDLDIVSPLETTRYMAPEAIADGVAPASDWWSVGMILLEKITQGACFEGQAFSPET